MLTAAMKAAGASTIEAAIEVSPGGFTAVASNGDLDRDGERIRPHCFDPLPESVPIGLDHTMTAAGVIGRGRPFYSGNQLLVDVKFASTPDAQQVRAKVKDRTLDSLSIVFRGQQWEQVDGVRTCTRGELLAVDIVSVPSNVGARVLSMRSMGGDVREQARHVTADALLALARGQVAECKSAGLYRGRGRTRRTVDDLLREALNPNESASAQIRRFKRSI